MAYTEAHTMWALWAQMLTAEIRLTQRCGNRTQQDMRLTGAGRLALERADRLFQLDLDDVTQHQYCEDCDSNNADPDLDYTHPPYCHTCQQQWPCNWIQDKAAAYALPLPELKPEPEPVPETRWTKETETDLLGVINSNAVPADKVREMLRYLADSGLLKHSMDYEPSP